MPIPVTCPACGHTFHVADRFAGRRGLCPACRSAVRVPDVELEPFPTVPEDEDDRPRRGRRDPHRPLSPRDHLPAWRRVGLGFLLQQLAAGLNLVALGLLMAATLVLPDDPTDFDREPDVPETVAAAVGLGAWFFGVVLQLVGRFVSATAPVRAPRAIGWASAILTAVQLPAGCVVGLLMAVAHADQPQAGNQPDAGLVVLVGLGVFAWLALAIAAEACHGFAVGSVGRVLRAGAVRTLGRGLGVYAAVAGFLMIVSLCGFGAWAEANNPDGQDPAAAKQEGQLMLGWLVGTAVLMGLYLMLDVVLLQHARSAIARNGEPSDGDESDDDGR